MTTLPWQQLMDQAGSGFEPVPDNIYEVTITKSEAKVSQNGRPMVVVTMTIESGPYAGKKLFNNFVLTMENPDALAFFFGHMKALGLDSSFFGQLQGSIEDSLGSVAAALMNRRCRVSTGQRSWNGQMRNNVLNVMPPLPGAGPLGGQAPAVAPLGQQPVAAPLGQPQPAPVAAAPQPQPQPQPAPQPAPAPPDSNQPGVGGQPVPQPQPQPQPAPPFAPTPQPQPQPAPAPPDPTVYQQPYVQQPAPQPAQPQPAPQPAPDQQAAMAAAAQQAMAQAEQSVADAQAAAAQAHAAAAQTQPVADPATPPAPPF
jgi:hypothetical protein